ncbi:MAG: hypothetical protein H0X12_01820 [Nocardioides sp.]|nr:hypothetical protein [Nocardioides sp.]
MNTLKAALVTVLVPALLFVVPAESVAQAPAVRLKVAWLTGEHVKVDLRDRFGPKVVFSPADGVPRAFRFRQGVLKGTSARPRSFTVTDDVRRKSRPREPFRTVRLTVDIVRPVASTGTTLVTRGYDGHPADADSDNVQVAGGGSALAYDSFAGNLVPGAGAIGSYRVYAWNRATATTTLVSRAADGSALTGRLKGISGEGRYVLFTSFDAGFTGPSDAGSPNRADLWLRDVVAGTTTRVALDVAAAQGERAELTDDASTVTFAVTTDVVGHATTYRWSRGTDAVTALPQTPVPDQPEVNLRWVGIASADGRYLLMSDALIDYHVYLVDSATGAIVWDRSTPFEIINAGEASLDGRLVSLSGFGPPSGGGRGGDTTGQILDGVSGAIIDDNDWGADLSPDGGWLASSDNQRRGLFITQRTSGRTFSAFGRPPRPASGDRDAPLPGSAGVTDDGSGVAYSHSAMDLVRGVRRNTRNVFFWARGG